MLARRRRLVEALDEKLAVVEAVFALGVQYVALDVGVVQRFAHGLDETAHDRFERGTIRVVVEDRSVLLT